MTLFRTSPEKVQMVAVGCLLTGLFLTVVNVFYTQRYFFLQLSDQTGIVSIAGTWGLAILINLYETALMSIMLSPDELSLPFMPAQIEPPPGFPKWIPSIIKWILLLVGFLLTWYTYRTDWISTAIGLGIVNTEARRVATGLLVFGGEIGALLHHLLWAVGRTGAVNTAPFWQSLKDAERRVRPAPATASSGAGAKAAGGSGNSGSGNKTSASDKVRQAMKSAKAKK